MKQTIGDIGQLRTELSFWRNHLEALNRSPKTIRNYLDSGEQLATFLEAKGMPTAVEAITREHIEAFVVAVMERTSSSTAATRFRALQQLFKWLAEDEGALGANPMARMKPPRLDEKQVAVIDEDSLRRLLKACEGRSFVDRRDAAVVRVLLSTGARVGELTGITMDDVDLDRRELRVMGKGRRERSLPLSPKAAKVVIRYLRERARHPQADSPYLWIGLRGRLTDSGVTQILRRRCEQAGIPRVHPHQFRHSFSHLFLARGGNEHDLARLNGWSSLQMVGRYAESAADERAKQAHGRLAPGEWL
ncbi:tyrosine recombinase XerC [soil metagenome]